MVVLGGGAVSYGRGTPVGSFMQKANVKEALAKVDCWVAVSPGVCNQEVRLQGYLAHKKQPPPLGPL